MDLTPYLASLREDLATTAAAADDQTRRAGALLVAALEPAVRLTLMNALADLAAEVTAHLPDHVVEVRLDGRDVRVVVTGGGKQAAPTAEAPAPPPPPASGDVGDISRITLRLVEQIKGQAEKAAAVQGVSLNTFVSQAVQRALGAAGEHARGGRSHRDAPGEGHRSDTHLHGWVQG
jgi:hypothetical protein